MDIFLNIFFSSQKMAKDHKKRFLAKSGHFWGPMTVIRAPCKKKLMTQCRKLKAWAFQKSNQIFRIYSSSGDTCDQSYRIFAFFNDFLNFGCSWNRVRNISARKKNATKLFGWHSVEIPQKGPILTKKHQKWTMSKISSIPLNFMKFPLIIY